MKGIYNIDKFFGGMSNDDYSGGPGMVFDAKNVDVGNSKGAILSRNFLNISFSNTRNNGQYIGIIEGNSFTNRLAFTKDGRATQFTNNDIDITSKVGTSVRNVGTIRYGGLLYGFIFSNTGSVGKVYRWQVNESSLDLGIGTNGANLTEVLTLPNDTIGSSYWNISHCSYLTNGPTLYVVGGNGFANNVFKIDTSTTTWTIDPDFLTIDFGYNISYMSNIGDQITIYATNGDSGKQYFRDGIGEAFDRHIDWHDRPILGGASINNIDYVITGTNQKRELYQVQGYQAIKLTETDVGVINNLKDKEKFYYDFEGGISNLIETVGDTLILPGQGQYYKFGNNRIGLPKNITRDMLFGFINMIYFNDSNSNNLILGFSTSQLNGTLTNYLGVVNIGQPTANGNKYSIFKPGIITTLKFDNNNYSQLKQAVKYRIGYDLPTKTIGGVVRGTFINVFARINNGKKWANFYSLPPNLGNYTTLPEIGAVYRVDNTDFIVYDITQPRFNNNVENKSNGYTLHCYTENLDFDGDKEISNGGILTKQSGVGDATVGFLMSDFGFQLIGKHDSYSTEAKKGKEIIMCNDKMETLEFNEIQFKFDLYTTQTELTPVLRDFKLLFNIIEDELN